MARHWDFFLICMVYPIAGLGGTPLLQQSVYDITTSAYFFEDHSGERTLEEVVQLKEELFKPLEQHSVRFGFRSSNLWFRFELDNRSDRSQWWLEVGEPRLQYLTLYQLPAVEAEEVVILRGGNSLPIAERSSSYRPNLFPLSILPGDRVTLLLKVTSKTAITLPLKVWQPDAFLKYVSKQNQLRLMLLGAVMGIGLLFLLISPFVGERYQFYYGAALFGFVMFGLSYNGLLHLFGLTLSGEWAVRPIVMASATASLFFMAFTRCYLELKEHSLLWYRIIGGLMGYDLLVLLMGGLADYQLAAYAISAVPPLTALGMLGATWVAIRSRVWSGWIYLLANAPFWGVVIVSFSRWEEGRLVHALPEDFPLFSIGVSGPLFLSVSFAYHFYRLRKDKERSQSELLQIQQQMVSQLELQVVGRTDALNRAKEQAEVEKQATDKILDTMSVGLLLIDGDEVIMRTNNTIQVLSGFGEEKLLSSHLTALLKKGDQDHADYQLHGDSEEKIPVSITRTPIQFSQEGILREVVMIHDLRKRIEEESERAQQDNQLAYQAGMAEIAANVMHNIGNVLTGLTGRSETIDAGLKDLLLIKKGLEKAVELEDVKTLQQGVKRTAVILGEVVEEDLQEGSRAFRVGVDHIAEIIAIQQELVRGSSVINVAFSLKQVIHDLLVLHEESLNKHDIHLDLKLSSEIDQVVLPKNPLMQVLNNLIKNAKEAIEQRRELEGSLTGRVELELSSYGERQFKLTLTDNGIGLLPDQKNSIFQRGVSTKEAGSGFGLHSVATFVSSIEGSIAVESDGVNQGATLILILPVKVN